MNLEASAIQAAVFLLCYSFSAISSLKKPPS